MVIVLNDAELAPRIGELFRRMAAGRLREPEKYGCDSMSCPNPVDAAVLADYWLAALAGSEEEAVEEQLLQCDSAAPRAGLFAASSKSRTGRLARSGDRPT